MLVLLANDVEQLRQEFIKYLAYTEDRERGAAISERKQSDARARLARANLCQSLILDLKGATLHKSDDAA